MLGQPSLALALLGLGAVHGLPTQQEKVEERAPQTLGPPSSSFTPGDAAPTIPCNPITDTACFWPGISPPPASGDGDSFTFGPLPRSEHAKRSSVDDLKRELVELERRLQYLQNLSDKSHADWDEIWDIRHELDRLAGIIKIIAPPGTVTTFTPGKAKKRQVLIFPGSGGQGNFDPSGCPSLDEAARALDKILRAIDRERIPRWTEDFAMQAYEAFLDRCNMGLEQVDDGDSIVIEVFRKSDHAHSGGSPLYPRDSADSFDVTGVRNAYDAMVAALDGATPEVGTWMVLQQLRAELAAQGAPLAKRQGSGGIIAIGQAACALADVLALKAALAALSVAYGTDKNSTPPSVYLVEQVIVSALQICHQDTPGWTTLTPGNPIPGGPMVPEKPVPGGPLVPEKPSPGGSLTPEKPAPGGPLIPERPIPGVPGSGSTITPERPIGGGRLEPERPGVGSPIRPSD